MHFVSTILEIKTIKIKSFEELENDKISVLKYEIRWDHVNNQF